MHVDTKNDVDDKRVGRDACCASADQYFLDPDREIVDVDGELVEVPLYVKPGVHLSPEALFVMKCV